MKTALFSLFLTSVALQTGCGPTNCDPRTPNPCGTTMPQSCDATTKMCTVEKACTTDLDCPGGFQCSSVLATCYRNCYNSIGNSGQDNYCQVGYRCNLGNVTCEKVASCTPNGQTVECNAATCDATTGKCPVTTIGCSADSACGDYSCDMVNKVCRSSCGLATDCAMGKTCDTASGKCM